MFITYVFVCALSLAIGVADKHTDICFVVSDEPLPYDNAWKACTEQGGLFFDAGWWIGNSSRAELRSKQAWNFTRQNNIPVWIIVSSNVTCNIRESCPKTTSLDINRYVCFYNRTATTDGRCVKEGEEKEEEEKGKEEKEEEQERAANSTALSPDGRPLHPVQEVALYAGVTVAAAVVLMLTVVPFIFFCRRLRRPQPKVRGSSRRSKPGASNHHVIVHQLSLPCPDSACPEGGRGPEGERATPPQTTPLGQGEYWFFEQPDLPWARDSQVSGGSGSDGGLDSVRGKGWQDRVPGENPAASHMFLEEDPKRSHVPWSSAEGAGPSQGGAGRGSQSLRPHHVRLGEYIEVSGSSQAASCDASQTGQGCAKFDTWSGAHGEREDLGSGRGRHQAAGRDKLHPFRPNAGYAEPVDSLTSGAPQWQETSAAASGGMQARGLRRGSAPAEPDYVRLAQEGGVRGQAPLTPHTEHCSGPAPAAGGTAPRGAWQDSEPNYDVLQRGPRSPTVAVNLYEHIINC